MTISRLPVDDSTDPLHANFFAELRAAGFEGEIDLSHASRAVLATDNSIYQRCHKPQATSHKPQATSHKPQATSHKPQAGGRAMRGQDS